MSSSGIRSKLITEDPGSSIPKKYYTKEQMFDISNYFFSINNIDGVRDRAMFLLSHSCLMRGEEIRKCKFSDLHLVEFEKECYKVCNGLLIFLHQYRHNALTMCIRNYEVELCPIGSLGFYLLYLWDVKQEVPPDLSSVSAWLDMLIIHGKAGNTHEMSGNGHVNVIRNCFLAVGVTAKPTTTINRLSGMRMLVCGGVDIAEIRLLSRCSNGEVLPGSYSTASPMASVKVLAGLEPQFELHILKRSSVDPSEDLQRMVFPWINAYLDGKKDFLRTLAAQKFLVLLKHLRGVVLQDASILINRYPNHPVFDLPVFKSQNFLSFKAMISD